MQAGLNKQMTYELYNKLRALSDATLASLAAWRDVEQYCQEHGYDVVEPAGMAQWMAVASRSQNTLKWLLALYPGPDDQKPGYWRTWEQGLLNGIGEHIYRTIELLTGRQPF